MINTAGTPQAWTPHDARTHTPQTQFWTDKLGHHHIDSYDGQHHVTRQESTWTDAQGLGHATTLTHEADGGTTYTHSAGLGRGSWNWASRTRHGQRVTESTISRHQDNSWGLSTAVTVKNQTVSQQSWHYQQGGYHDYHGTRRMAKGGTTERSYQRLTGNTYDVRQQTRGADGRLQQEWESTQEGGRRFAGHHYRYTPQGVDRQTWWQGVQSIHQAPGSATMEVRRLQQSLGMFATPDMEAYDATA